VAPYFRRKYPDISGGAGFEAREHGEDSEGGRFDPDICLLIRFLPDQLAKKRFRTDDHDRLVSSAVSPELSFKGTVFETNCK
jgi:hypothetical protein